MDCSPTGFSIHGISQLGILEWVAISYEGDLPNPGIEPEDREVRKTTIEVHEIRTLDGREVIADYL